MIELILEDRKHMTHHLVKIGSPLSYKFATLLDIRTNLRQDQFRVNLTVAFDQRLSQNGGHKMPRPILNGYVTPLDNVADMGRDRSIGANTMFLHLSYQVRFSKVPRWCRATLDNAG